MCGIVGAVSNGNIASYLLDGLRRLEYRGYDSAGIAVVENEGKLKRSRTIGRVDALADVLANSPLRGTVGLGHTRWATHGGITELNAHPHRLDLDWRQLRRANELGAKVAINTDAHRQSNLDHLHLGVGIGRKAWLTSEDVINCLDTESLRQYLTNGQRYH